MSATQHTEHVELPIGGMTCASCAARVERKLNKLDGVSARVNYATERAAIDYDAERVQPDELLGAVQGAGYEAASRPECVITMAAGMSITTSPRMRPPRFSGGSSSRRSCRCRCL